MDTVGLGSAARVKVGTGVLVKAPNVGVFVGVEALNVGVFVGV
jgi:hypothetical protein